MSGSGEDLDELRASARHWAADAGRACGPGAAAGDAVAVRTRWRELASLGWAGVAIDEAHGGSGLGPRAAALIAHELGRELLPTPFLSTAWLAATLIGAEGTAAQQERWLGPIARGELIVAAAFDELWTGTAGDSRAQPAASATRSGGGWTIRADLPFVPDGGAADLLLVAARLEDAPGSGTGLFLVPAAAAERSALQMVDQRDWARCRLPSVDVADEQCIGGVRGGSAALECLLAHAQAGMAAEMVGMAERALELTLDYLRSRVQFGQPIGAFQALQHRAAVAHCELQLASVCGDAAAEALESGAGDQASLAALAKHMAGRALHLISNEMIQLHGGIGMTAEHAAGHYLKRARIAETLYGNAPALTTRYAELMGY